MARLPRISPIETPDSVPRYEIRIAGRGPGNGEDEIWQLPARDTPRVAASARIAGLRGRNLELVEHRVLKRLAQAGVKPQSGLNGRKCGYAVTEDVALTLGLLFRAKSTRSAGSCDGAAISTPGTHGENHWETTSGVWD